MGGGKHASASAKHHNKKDTRAKPSKATYCMSTCCRVGCSSMSMVPLSSKRSSMYRGARPLPAKKCSTPPTPRKSGARLLADRMSVEPSPTLVTALERRHSAGARGVGGMRNAGRDGDDDVAAAVAVAAVAAAAVAAAAAADTGAKAAAAAAAAACAAIPPRLLAGAWLLLVVWSALAAGTEPPMVTVLMS